MKRRCATPPHPTTTTPPPPPLTRGSWRLEDSRNLSAQTDGDTGWRLVGGGGAEGGGAGGGAVGEYVELS